MTLKILSLGAGVQSTTIMRMSCLGQLPKLDAAIFADTGWEKKVVYENLKQLIPFALEHDIPVYMVRKSNIKQDLLKAEFGDLHNEQHHASPPLYILNRDSSVGQLKRQCTSEYKIEMIEKKARELLGLQPRQHAPTKAVQMWIGISTDEASRATMSRVRWYTKEFPLIFMKPMRRAECIDWNLQNGFPVPPESSCVCCPYHDAAGWRHVKEDPVAWRELLRVDKKIRERPGLNGKAFLNRQCVPMEELDIRTDEEAGQQRLFECTGHCQT